MELAKVTTKGQVTIPKSIRDLLGLKEGSKILFIQKGNDIVIQNSAMLALDKIVIKTNNVIIKINRHCLVNFTRQCLYSFSKKTFSTKWLKRCKILNYMI